MINSAQEFVRLRTSEDPQEYLRAANEAASEAVWLEIIAKYPEMRVWVAHNKTISASILQILANDPDPSVRGMVARKRKLDISLIEKLAYDRDDAVRAAIAHNPKTPDTILRALVDDPWDEIARVAERRLTVH
jgi:hypothetical protein